MSDLDDRLQEAAGPAAPFPVEAVRARVQRRQRRRAGAGGIAAVLLAVSVGMAVLPPGPAVDLEVGAGPTGSPVDVDLAQAPTRLPDGYDRCGTVTHGRGVTVQRFCNPDGDELVLRFGRHDRLPEVGRHLDEVRGRPVYVDVIDGLRLVTISDRRADDDAHYRVEAPRHVSTSALVDVIASVPAFIAATGDGAAATPDAQSQDQEP